MDPKISKMVARFQFMIDKIRDEGPSAETCEIRGVVANNLYMNGVLATKSWKSYSEYPDFLKMKDRGEGLVRVRFPAFNKSYWGYFIAGEGSTASRFELALWWPDINLAGYSIEPLAKIVTDWRELLKDAQAKNMEFKMRDNFKLYLGTLEAVINDAIGQELNAFAEPLFWWSYKEFLSYTESSTFAEEKKVLYDKFKALGGVADEFINYFYSLLARYNDDQLEFYRKKMGEAVTKLGRGEALPRLLERIKDVKDFLSIDGKMVLEETVGRVQEVMGASSKTHEFYRDVDYLTVVGSMPFDQAFDYRNVNLPNSIAAFNTTHFGMMKAKRSLAEALALKVRGINNSEVICLVGPPGTGKTTLANSLARSIGVASRAISLAGVSDEAVIRGISRFYVGAASGRVIKEWRSSSIKNPVIILDEIDKMSSNGKGNPAAALLELLDPEQNRAFTDQFIGFPIDLSQVLWVCTANYVEQIPVELKDRIVMIEVPGYSRDEQASILHDFLIPKYRLQWGLDIEIDSSLDGFFVKEKISGVRDMEHDLQHLCKSIILDTALNVPCGFNEAYISATLDKKLLAQRKPIGFHR